MSFLSIEKSTSESKFTSPTFAPCDFGKSLDGSKVGANSNINLFNCKFRILWAVSNIASWTCINTCSNAVPRNSGDNWNAAVFETRSVPLKFTQIGINLDGLSRGIRFLLIISSSFGHALGWLQVNACGKMFPFTSEHNDPNIILDFILNCLFELTEHLEWHSVVLFGSI